MAIGLRKSELRLLLEDELSAIEEQMQQLENEAKDFWLHPDKPALSVYANFPVLKEIPSPPTGSITEHELYNWLMKTAKPYLESRLHGFDTVPILYPHDKHYKGPPFRTRFLPVVMGAEVIYPSNIPLEERTGWHAGVKPLIKDISEVYLLEDIDVSKSPALKAVLRGYEEIEEIVQGRISIAHYSPTMPMDMAADLIGHEVFYELIAADYEATSNFIDICTGKWFEMMELQEKAAGGRWANSNYEPGLYVNDMILPFLSPKNIRDTILPYNEKLSTAYNGICVVIKHQDYSLLDDYLKLPNLFAISILPDWPEKPLMDAMKDKIVLKLDFNWHFHKGKKQESPVCFPWEQCCGQLAKFAGKLRVHVNLAGWGDTPQEKLDCLLRDLYDLRRIWEHASAESHGKVI